MPHTSVNQIEVLLCDRSHIQLVIIARVKRTRFSTRLLKEVLLEFPALVKLVYRLLRDSRVSTMDKAILGAIVVYLLNPMDLMPDAIPGLGQIDDAYLIALGLLRLLARTDEAVIRELWPGKRDVIALLNQVVEVAVVFIPKRARRILMGKVAHWTPSMDRPV